MEGGKQNESLVGFVMKDSVFTYDRLAEDVLSYLYEVHKVQKRIIPPHRFAENNYGDGDAIPMISRQIQLDQIMYRRIFYDMFKQRNPVNIDKYIAESLENVRDTLLKEERKCSPIVMFHISFALVTEMTLFFLSRNNRGIVKKMAHSWVSYFNHHLKLEFETSGGLSRVIQRAYMTSHMESYLEGFIPRHCIPYSGQDVHQMFVDLITQRTSEISELQWTIRSLDIIKNIACARLGIAPETMESSSDDTDTEPDPVSDLPIHDRLGIVPHEDILKQEMDRKSPVAESDADADAASTDAATAAAIAALSLAAERKKAKKAKGQSYTSIVRSGLRRAAQPITAQAGSSSSVVPTQPEVGPSDRVPSLHGSYQSDPVPTTEMTRSSSSENQTTPQPDSASFRGAKPKTRRSSKK